MRLRLLFLLLSLTPGAVGAETIAGFRVVGAILCIPSVVIVIVSLWLYKRIPGIDFYTITIFAFSVASLIPLGITYVGEGVVVPNFVLLSEGRDIGYGINAFLTLVNVIAFVRTR